MPKPPRFPRSNGLSVRAVPASGPPGVALGPAFPRLSAAERPRLEVDVRPGDVHGSLNVPPRPRSLAPAPAWLESFHPEPVAPPANGSD